MTLEHHWYRATVYTQAVWRECRVMAAEIVVSLHDDRTWTGELHSGRALDNRYETRSRERMPG